MAHAPQLAGSFCSSTHALPHLVVPPTHTQTLAAQKPPAPHWVPQAPQFEGSFVMFTQRALAPLPHSTVPPVHIAWQPPPLHTEPAPHTVPQVPQLPGSLCVSTHTEPHSVS